MSTDETRACDYQGDNGFSIALFYAQSVDANTQGAEPVVINSGAHRALQRPTVSGRGCTVGMEVTPSSSVDVIVENAELDQAKSCELAKLIAQAVEPNLPRG